MWFRKDKIPRAPRDPRTSSSLGEGLFVKCEGCREALYVKEVERNLRVCPKCGFHFRMPAAERMRLLRSLMEKDGLTGLYNHSTTKERLAQAVDLARRQGHPTLSLVTANAVSGGFLSFGLMADRTYALSDAQVRVMDLKAMARVTKIAHERLLELAASSPIFAPGAENYRRMGAIEAIWPAPSEALLVQALADIASTGPGDLRMEKGLQRGGRVLAANIAELADRGA